MNGDKVMNRNNQKQMNPYVKFTLMILTSTVVMYIMMYFNTYEWNHIYSVVERSVGVVMTFICECEMFE